MGLSRYTQKHTSGFSLVEMLVYIAILILVCGAALTLLFTLGDRIASQRAYQHVSRNAQASMERILTEIRIAEQINPGDTVLETNPGSLSVTYGATTTEFFIATSTLFVRVNSGSSVALTSDAVDVSELRFFSYSNAQTDMVRVEMTLSSEVGDESVERSFQGGAVVRGTYE